MVPQGWLDDIAGNGDPKAWREGQWGETFAAISRKMRYRSGWYVIDDEPQILFAMGIHGQNLFVDVDNRVMIAKVSSLNTPIDPQAVWLTHKAVREFARCINGAAPRAMAAG